MFTAEITCAFTARRLEPDECVDQFVWLLAALSKHGQIAALDWPTTIDADGLRAHVIVPERESLQPRHHNTYVRERLRELARYGLSRPRVRILGRDPTTAACTSAHPSFYILFTAYLRVEPPLRSGDTFAPIPLYRIPPLRDGEYADLVSWATAYRDCDSLQMMCGPGEGFAMRQMGDVRSALSINGRGLCREIESKTGIPTYYYLHRGGDATRSAELKRLCPGCGRAWRRERPLHDMFDFRCDACRLLSNIAWSCREMPTD